MPHHVLAEPYHACHAAKEGQVIGLGKRHLADSDVDAVRVVRVFGRVDLLEAHLHQVPVLSNRIRLPLPLAVRLTVAVGRPAQEGEGRFWGVGQICLDGKAIAVDSRQVPIFEVDAAIALLAGEQQRGSIGTLVHVGGEVVVQDLDRLGHHDVGDVVLVVVGEGLYAQSVLGNVPSLFIGSAAVAEAVKAAGDGGVGYDSGHSVGCDLINDADVTNPVIILIAPADEGRLQARRQYPEVIIVAGILIGLRILEGDGHFQAVILAHGQAGEVPLFVIGVDGLLLVQFPVGHVVTPGLRFLLALVQRNRFAGIGQHDHQPDHTHLVGRAPIGGVGPVEHPGREGHAAAAALVGNDVQRHVGQQVAIVVLLADGDAIGLQLALVEPVVHLGPSGPAGRRTGLDRQVAIAIVIGDGDLQHGDQTHIAVGVEVGIVLVLLLGEILERRIVVFVALNLAVVVSAGPVQHVESIGEVSFLSRTQLKIHKDGLILLEVFDFEFEGTIVVKGVVWAAHLSEGREVNLIGDAVIVVVSVKQVGDVVAIGVFATGYGVGRRIGVVGRKRIPTLLAIHQAVVVGVRVVRVRVPPLAAPGRPLETPHLHTVGDLVTVAVGIIGVGAQPGFLQVSQAVAVVVAFGVGEVFVVLLQGHLGGEGWGLEVGGWILGIRYWVLVIRDLLVCDLLICQRITVGVPIRGRQFLLIITGGFCFFLALLLFRLAGGNALGKGEGLVAL